VLKLGESAILKIQVRGQPSVKVGKVECLSIEFNFAILYQLSSGTSECVFSKIEVPGCCSLFKERVAARISRCEIDTGPAGGVDF
jgi:hypothetical protein